MKNGINNNGYEYVDLGLPSGTLWATKNIGASKPSDYGLYFQWSDTSGYTADQVGYGDGQKKFASDESDYKFGVYPNYSKYTTKGATLDLEDDAAHVHMGGEWHMPTPDQIRELIDNTTSTWTTQDGVNGRLFTSKKDNSKSIFIPAAGVAWGGSVRGSGDDGLVWSSMLGTDSANNGQYLGFLSGDVGLYGSYRYGGLSVRGVIDKKNVMNENLNLVEILKDVPAGMKLWSPICGECELLDTNSVCKDLPIVCIGIDDGFEWYFRADGTFVDNTGVECVLFPSKDNRDWSTFKVPKKHKHFEPFQKVLCAYDHDYGYEVWAADFYSHYEEATCEHFLVSGFTVSDSEIIPYEGNEDKLGKPVK